MGKNTLSIPVHRGRKYMNTMNTQTQETFEKFVLKPFTYGKKDENGQTVQHSTTLVDCKFSRLPSNKDWKDSRAYTLLNDLYTAVCHLAVQKSDNQRDKYAQRTRDAIKAWFAYANIANNSGNVTGFTMVCGIKKSTTKGEVNSALPSKSTFFKNVLFCTHSFVKSKTWVTKDPLIGKTNSTVATNISTYEQLEQLYIVQFGMSAEIAKALVQKAKEAKVG